MHCFLVLSELLFDPDPLMEPDWVEDHVLQAGEVLEWLAQIGKYVGQVANVYLFLMPTHTHTHQ